MKTALYSSIAIFDNALTEQKIITRAQNAGYSLVLFNGFDDDDCRNRKNDMIENRAILNEINALFPDWCGYTSIEMLDTIPERKQMSPDDEEGFAMRLINYDLS